MPQEYLDERFFRIKRAMQASLLHAPLPKELHTPELEVPPTYTHLARAPFCLPRQFVLTGRQPAMNVLCF